MKTLIESGFFGTKSLLTEAFADKDKVRLFQAAYNYTYDKNIAVDGIKGTQTNAAIEDVKKQLSKEKLDNEGAKAFYEKFLTKLDDNKSSINVGQGGTNTNKVLNYAIQTLINLAGTPLGIDGVVGTKTLAAIKTVTEDSEVINAENITTITGKAIKYILELGVEGIATAQGGAAKTPQQVEAESREAWKKYPCITQADGIIEDKYSDGSIVYFDKNKANLYFANGRKMRMVDNVKEDYYCNGMTVTIGAMSDNTKADGKCESGNCVNGEGVLITAAGDTQTGTFVNGKLTGKNNKIIFKQSGAYFEGETKDGYMVQGLYVSDDASRYNGYFRNNKIEGLNSRYRNPKGKNWIGNFSGGSPDGATWKQLDAVEDDGQETRFPTAAMQSAANESKFASDMAKFKAIVDAKIAEGTATIAKRAPNTVIGNYSKVGNGLQILDANNNPLFTTTTIPNELKEVQGKWSYFTGGGGKKIMQFSTTNYVTKYNYTF